MTPSRYGEIEIGLHRSQPETCDVELRVTDPGTDAELAPARGQSRISLGELARLCDLPDDYGALLAAAVFSDQTIREFWLKNKVSFESRGLLLRLRVLIGPSVPELHGLRWELLCDPETKLPLATSERVLFSRFMLSRDWRVVKLRPKAQLKALIAVAAPSDIVAWKMAEVDYAGEVERACNGLTGIDATALDKPVTLDRLVEGLRRGADILYLVCHGSLPKGEEPCLYLQNDEGKTEVVLASTLARRIEELPEAPRLAEAGVPAVLAMQDRISMETVKRAMPDPNRTMPIQIVSSGLRDESRRLERDITILECNVCFLCIRPTHPIWPRKPPLSSLAKKTRMVADQTTHRRESRVR